MEYSSLNAPSTAISIVGFNADENPHKRAKFSSLFNDSTVNHEKSGWTSDPIVSNDDTAQTAPSTCSVQINDTDWEEHFKRPTAKHKAYKVTPKYDPATGTTSTELDSPVENLVFESTKKGTNRAFGTVLTEPEQDGTALVSVQWRASDTGAWPGVYLNGQKNQGYNQGATCTFAVQHATVVNLGTEETWKVGQKVYYVF